MLEWDEAPPRVFLDGVPRDDDSQDTSSPHRQRHRGLAYARAPTHDERRAIDHTLRTKYPLRDEVDKPTAWSPFDASGAPRRSPRGSRFAQTGAASLSPRSHDAAARRYRDEYPPLRPEDLAARVYREEVREEPPSRLMGLGGGAAGGDGFRESEGKKHVPVRGRSPRNILEVTSVVPRNHAVGARAIQGGRAHVSFAGQESSVDEIVFGRDLDGSGAVLDAEVLTRKGVVPPSGVEALGEVVFKHESPYDRPLEGADEWLDRASSKKIFRGAFDASVDTIVFGRDTDGSGAVLDGGGMNGASGGYFCTKGMDYYSNRDLGARKLPNAAARAIPSPTQIVVAHSQSPRLQIHGGGGRRIRWNETVPYHEPKPVDESIFRPAGRML